jgi:hypothetical protein
MGKESAAKHNQWMQKLQNRLQTKFGSKAAPEIIVLDDAFRQRIADQIVEHGHLDILAQMSRMDPNKLRKIAFNSRSTTKPGELEYIHDALLDLERRSPTSSPSAEIGIDALPGLKADH